MQCGSNAAHTGLTDRVKLEVIPPAKWWHRPTYKLVEDVEVAGHVVPAGFVTDGATVPRGIAVTAGLLALLCHFLNCDWGAVLFVLVAVGVIYFPPIGRYLKAAIVHDWLLEGWPGDGVVRPDLHAQLYWLADDVYRQRQLIDQEFKRVMVVLAIAAWRRVVMYVAVRVNSGFKGLFL